VELSGLVAARLAKLYEDNGMEVPKELAPTKAASDGRPATYKPLALNSVDNRTSQIKKRMKGNYAAPPQVGAELAADFKHFRGLGPPPLAPPKPPSPSAVRWPSFKGFVNGANSGYMDASAKRSAHESGGEQDGEQGGETKKKKNKKG